MPIQIIDNFELTSDRPIDNRLVVGTNSFYTNKDDITNKYSGMRIWELPGSNLTGGGTNSTAIGLGYVWTGTSWGSENTTAISGGGTPDRLAYFNTGNTIQSSNIYFNGTNIGIAGAAEPLPFGSRLVVTGNIKSIGGQFIGNGSSLTNLNATQLTGGTVPIARIPGATTGWILTADSTLGASYKNPSSITVGTASALQIPRTLWGQSFNGTSNVSGNIVNAGTIQFGSQPNKATLSYNVNSTITLTVPSLGSNRTFAFIDQAQTFSAAQTMGNLTTTGLLRIADGTAFSPSLSFTSDTNTGIYRIGASQFALVANGVERMKINTTGVSIGTSGSSLARVTVGTIRIQQNGTTPTIERGSGFTAVATTSGNTPVITVTLTGTVGFDILVIASMDGDVNYYEYSCAAEKLSSSSFSLVVAKEHGAAWTGYADVSFVCVCI